ncbi:MAG TPA: metallophosphoesterase [Bryobacteraceae bacterium]|nr:metallophosphoesterase [Bryobacteraceae bacterium]
MLKKQLSVFSFLLATVVATLLAGCDARSQTPVSQADTGPLLRRTDAQMSSAPFLISYGDIRFTNPSETKASNPKVRRWLAEKIAAEKPDALLVSGDIPWHGGEKDDYAQFLTETAAWRAANLFVSPALGNHEVNSRNVQQCLENWWAAFPALRGHRWYAVQLGSSLYVLNLDSNSDLRDGSAQRAWIDGQLAHVPESVKFILFNLHHPPAADNQPDGDSDHNERPNELALAAWLETAQPRSRAQFLVIAGHIHNYERFLRDGIPYIVSGGGGAEPRLIRRHEGDLYLNAPAVNYHYLRMTLHGDRLDAEMVRVADPDAAQPAWEVRDRFTVGARRQ